MLQFWHTYEIRRCYKKKSTYLMESSRRPCGQRSFDNIYLQWKCICKPQSVLFIHMVLTHSLQDQLSANPSTKWKQNNERTLWAVFIKSDYLYEYKHAFTNCCITKAVSGLILENKLRSVKQLESGCSAQYRKDSFRSKLFA